MSKSNLKLKLKSNLKSKNPFNIYANNYARAYDNTYFDYLPKEIIDIIHEYNADHRPTYNKVLEELLELRDACLGCARLQSWAKWEIRFYCSSKKCAFCNGNTFIYEYIWSDGTSIKSKSYPRYKQEINVLLQY